MQNAPVSSPNDYKVVKFHNNTDFDFTHDMGCMFNSSPISGVRGVLGIGAGEEMTLPYHVGHRLAVNLAKMVMVKGDNGNPPKDQMGNPMVAAIWSDTRLEEVKNSFLVELYSETKPIAQSDTDKLLAKVEEYKVLFEKALGGMGGPIPAGPVGATTPAVTAPFAPPQDNDHVAPGASQFPAADGAVYKDKAEVIAELTKRGVAHDKRKSKAELEKLLA